MLFITEDKVKMSIFNIKHTLASFAKLTAKPVKMLNLFFSTKSVLNAFSMRFLATLQVESSAC